MVIFVRIVRRVGNFNELSKMYKAAELRVHFNDALNNAVAKISQRILTINSCNAYEDFERGGRLSPKGFKAFWHEVDNLLDRYEWNKVKLLLNPKNLPRKHYRQPYESSHTRDFHSDARRSSSTNFRHY